MPGTFGQIWCHEALDEWPDDPEAVTQAGSLFWKDSAIEAGTLARSVYKMPLSGSCITYKILNSQENPLGFIIPASMLKLLLQLTQI